VSRLAVADYIIALESGRVYYQGNFRQLQSKTDYLGAVVDFDLVAMLRSGRLLEWDSPEALLGLDSEFKRLWDLGSNSSVSPP
jgi:ABC-type multidrug transport system fused ATPase/permease subunit